MKAQRIDNYYKEIVEFCKLKNIPIKNGKVLPEHIGEVHNYIQKIRIRDWKHRQANKIFEKNTFKSVVGKRVKERFIRNRHEDG